VAYRVHQSVVLVDKSLRSISLKFLAGGGRRGNAEMLL